MEEDLTYILPAGDLHKHLTLKRGPENTVQLQRMSGLFSLQTITGPPPWVAEWTFGLLAGPRKPDLDLVAGAVRLFEKICSGCQLMNLIITPRLFSVL